MEHGCHQNFKQGGYIVEFNKLISEKLDPLFKKNGFKLIEESKNIVKYKLCNLVIKMVHNPYENNNILWIGRNDFQEIEINNQLMKEFFFSDLKLSNLPKDIFINNVFLFFLGYGKGVIKGNEFDVINLERFYKKKNRKYTKNLIEKQCLDLANKAWKEKKYADVIKYLKKLNKKNLPISFKLKYKYAQKNHKT